MQHSIINKAHGNDRMKSKFTTSRLHLSPNSANTFSTKDIAEITSPLRQIRLLEKLTKRTMPMTRSIRKDKEMTQRDKSRIKARNKISQSINVSPRQQLLKISPRPGVFGAFQLTGVPLDNEEMKRSASHRSNLLDQEMLGK